LISILNKDLTTIKFFLCAHILQLTKRQPLSHWSQVWATDSDPISAAFTHVKALKITFSQ